MKDAQTFEIVNLADNEKITEPGFYRIPLSRHHAQPCDGISVTSSTLRNMLIHGPEYVWAFHDLNENRYERPETDALRLGRAMAAIVEGGAEALEELFFVLPTDKPSRPTEAQLKKYEEGNPSEAGLRSIRFWRKVEADPRGVLTEDEWDMITQMGSALASDPIASACLRGDPEVTMAWYDEETDLWVLSRPDVLSVNGLLSDYKKVSTQGAAMTGRLVDRKITNYRYDMQMALGVEAYHQLTSIWSDTVGLVFQMDKPPYSVIPRGLTDEDLSMGMFENRRQRIRFRECLNNSHWPGPGEVIENYQRPEWMAERYRAEMA